MRSIRVVFREYTYAIRLVPKIRQFLLVGGGVLVRLAQLPGECQLPDVVRLGLDLSLLLEPIERTQSVPCSLFRTTRLPSVENIKVGVTKSLLTDLLTTSSYFQPTSWLNLPTVQYFLPGFNLRILRA